MRALIISLGWFFMVSGAIGVEPPDAEPMADAAISSDPEQAPPYA